jgi:hypothetical protein
VAEELLSSVCNTQIIRRFETFVEFECSVAGEAVRIQLAYDSPFRFQPPVETDLSIRVNDYDDLIVDKLLAFFGRVEPRDAVDLFFILAHEDIWELAERAARKDPGFDLYWLAVGFEKATALPDDIMRYPLEMILPLDAAEMKKLYTDLALDAMKRIRKQ